LRASLSVRFRQRGKNPFARRWAWCDNRAGSVHLAVFVRDRAERSCPPLWPWALDRLSWRFAGGRILSVSTGSKEKGVLTGVAVGSVIALEALFAGPVSGASMNPARSFAPAVVSGHLDSLWVYLVAPPLGSCLSAFGCRCVHDNPCCRAPAKESCP
jgi:hypothetical protein